MNKLFSDDYIKNKHNENISKLFNTFDIQAIPEDFIKILDRGKIDFICTSRKMNFWCKVGEICVIFPDLTRKIYVLFDYGYCMKYDEIIVNECKTSEQRNHEIERLYYEVGLTQQFVGKLFRLSQPSISVILKKGRNEENE